MNLPDNQALGGAAGDTISGVENVSGSGFDDILRPAKNGYAYGYDGKDTVIDLTGTEVLRGGDGEDTLGDNLVEDGLRDIFFLEPYMGRDTIFGFDQDTDLFWLSTDPGRTYPSFQSLAFDAQGKPALGRLINDSDNDGVADPTQNYAQLIFDTNTRILWYDEDGTGTEVDAVEVALLSGFNGTLKTSDFQGVPDELMSPDLLLYV